MKTTEPLSPSRRTGAKSHLARAAKSSIDSVEEHYSLVAAIAESLVDATEELSELNVTLRGIRAEIAGLRADLKGEGGP